MSEETYTIYAKALESCDDRDIRTALGAISMRRRRDGETAFPDLGTVLDEVREAKRDRLATATIDRINAEVRHRQENPEEYCSVAGVFKEVMERVALKRVEG